MSCYKMCSTCKHNGEKTTEIQKEILTIDENAEFEIVDCLSACGLDATQYFVEWEDAIISGYDIEELVENIKEEQE